MLNAYARECHFPVYLVILDWFCPEAVYSNKANSSAMVRSHDAGRHMKTDSTLYYDTQFIRAAGEKKIKLLLFPEGAIAGYPWFNWWATTWDMDNNEHINQLFIENSVEIGVDGGDLAPLMKCAKEARVNVVMPVNERDNKGVERI